MVVSLYLTSYCQLLCTKNTHMLRVPAHHAFCKISNPQRGRARSHGVAYQDPIVGPAYLSAEWMTITNRI